MGARHVTLSTVGIVPGINRLAAAYPQVGLAVSLHAADDGLRSRLVPPNDRYPLAALEEAVAGWRRATRRRPSIEWAMIRGVNDDDDQAELLAPIARRLVQTCHRHGGERNVRIRPQAEELHPFRVTTASPEWPILDSEIVETVSSEHPRSRP